MLSRREQTVAYKLDEMRRVQNIFVTCEFVTCLSLTYRVLSAALIMKPKGPQKEGATHTPPSPVRQHLIDAARGSALQESGKQVTRGNARVTYPTFVPTDFA